MRILFLIQGFEVAASRYRVLQLVPTFVARGWQATVEPFPDRAARWHALWRRLPDYEVVFNQRRRYGPWAMRRLRRGARALVYDFDDAVMFRNALHGRQTSWGRRRRFARMARQADLLLCGNAFLVDQSRPWAARAALVPTPVDLTRARVKDYEAPGDGRVRLGWIGAHGSLHYLARLVPVLEALGRRFPALVLRQICDHFLDVPDLTVEKVPWDEATEAARVAELDVGLMPLGEDPWSRGKCALKILQYGAAAVPAVCTPVGMNADVVAHGVTGLHARTPSEWETALATLIEDAGSRRRLGEALRARVAARYDLPVVADRVERLCRALAEGRPPAPELLAPPQAKA